MLLLVAKKKLNTYLLALINHINWNVSIYLQLLRKSLKKADVGLRRTCAYYRTFARAMCVRKCVRKGLETCVCDVRACVLFLACDVRSHFCTLFWTKWQEFLFWNILFSNLEHLFLLSNILFSVFELPFLF